MGFGFFLGFVESWSKKLYWGVMSLVFGSAIISGILISTGEANVSLNFAQIVVGVIGITAGSHIGKKAYREVTDE